MKKTLPESDREALAKIGLDADAPGLVNVVAAADPKAPAILAPEGVDPHAMPVTSIAFDPALLDEFTDLDDNDQRNRASTKVFDLYKSPPRTNKDRNSLLWKQIGHFIGRVRVARKGDIPVEHVKDKVRKTKAQGDLLQTMAALGINSVDDLKALLETKEEA